MQNIICSLSSFTGSECILSLSTKYSLQSAFLLLLGRRLRENRSRKPFGFGSSLSQNIGGEKQPWRYHCHFPNLSPWADRVPRGTAGAGVFKAPSIAASKLSGKFDGFLCYFCFSQGCQTVILIKNIIWLKKGKVVENVLWCILLTQRYLAPLTPAFDVLIGSLLWRPILSPSPCRTGWRGWGRHWPGGCPLMNTMAQVWCGHVHWDEAISVMHDALLWHSDGLRFEKEPRNTGKLRLRRSAPGWWSSDSIMQNNQLEITGFGSYLSCCRYPHSQRPSDTQSASACHIHCTAPEGRAKGRALNPGRSLLRHIVGWKWMLN